MHSEPSPVESLAMSKTNTTMNEINAYVLIQAHCGSIDKVLLETKNIKQVMSTAVISGKYDVLVKVNVPRLEDLFNVSEKIKMINGIQQATTHIVEKEVFT